MNESFRNFAVGLALGASLIAATPASAAVVINPILGGTYTAGAFQADDIGTIKAIRLATGNEYDFTFTVAPDAVVVLSQVQASSIGFGKQLINFSIFSGSPLGVNSFVASSGLPQTGPSITNMLGMGNYFIKVTNIALNNELLTGGIDVAAEVPEPASWAMMVVGFGLVGFAARRRSGAVAA